MTKSEIITRIEQLETQIRHAEQKKSVGRDMKLATILIETAIKEIAQLHESLEELEK
jgi:hypothetical protein